MKKNSNAPTPAQDDMRPEYRFDYSQSRPNRFAAMLGKSRAVLSLRRYKKLMEDLHDLGVVAERRSEPTISF
jgi:hypothetical protein